MFFLPTLSIVDRIVAVASDQHSHTMWHTLDEMYILLLGTRTSTEHHSHYNDNKRGANGFLTQQTNVSTLVRYPTIGILPRITI